MTCFCILLATCDPPCDDTDQCIMIEQLDGTVVPECQCKQVGGPLCGADCLNPGTCSQTKEGLL